MIRVMDLLKIKNAVGMQLECRRVVYLLGHIKTVVSCLPRGDWSDQGTEWWWLKVITSAVFFHQDLSAGFTNCPVVTTLQGYSS